MRLSKALQGKLMDTRLRDKLVAEGKVTASQVEEYFKNLSDDSENMSIVKDAENKIEVSEE